MFFLLRLAFWLSVVCILLPGGGEKAPSTVDTLQAMSAAGAAYSDMRGFCERQPDACEVGGQVATALGHRAQEGAKTIAEFISTKMTESNAPSKPGVRGTLTAADLQPAWQGAPPAKEQVPLPPARPRREAQNHRPAA